MVVHVFWHLQLDDLAALLDSFAAYDMVRRYCQHTLPLRDAEILQFRQPPVVAV